MMIILWTKPENCQTRRTLSHVMDPSQMQFDRSLLSELGITYWTHIWFAPMSLHMKINSGRTEIAFATNRTSEWHFDLMWVCSVCCQSKVVLENCWAMSACKTSVCIGNGSCFTAPALSDLTRTIPFVSEQGWEINRIFISLPGRIFTWKRETYLRSFTKASVFSKFSSLIVCTWTRTKNRNHNKNRIKVIHESKQNVPFPWWSKSYGTEVFPKCVCCELLMYTTNQHFPRNWWSNNFVIWTHFWWLIYTGQPLHSTVCYKFLLGRFHSTKLHNFKKMCLSCQWQLQ